MYLSVNDYYIGEVGALFIVLGIMFGEGFVNNSLSSWQGYVGLTSFIIGWILFLATQGKDLLWLKGAAVALVAILGQFYFSQLLKESIDVRAKWIWLTAFFWMTFIGLWIYYAYDMTLSKSNTNKKQYDEGKAVAIWSGVALLMVGMMGYFFIRKNDWYELTGGIMPRMKEMKKEVGGVFNPFVPLIGFGWALIAVGNSAK